MGMKGRLSGNGLYLVFINGERSECELPRIYYKQNAGSRYAMFYIKGGIFFKDVRESIDEGRFTLEFTNLVSQRFRMRNCSLVTGRWQENNLTDYGYDLVIKGESY